jgi:hypothetical protein
VVSVVVVEVLLLVVLVLVGVVVVVVVVGVVVVADEDVLQSWAASWLTVLAPWVRFARRAAFTEAGRLDT